MYNKNNKVQYIIYQQMKDKIYHLQSETVIPDVFTTSNLTSSQKYITKDGRVRLDINFDVFKEIFNQSLWNMLLCQMLIADEELMKKTPYRVQQALEMYNIKPKVAELAEMIRTVRPMFDYREKEKPPQ